ncbi:MAG: histidine kinase [Ruminococcus sp.]|nr:histidine kinase [Ruminococcus sp.]
MSEKKLKLNPKKVKKTLLFQIGAVLLPLFVLLIAGVSVVVYNSITGSYLDAQNAHIEYLLDQIYNKYFLLEEPGKDDYTLTFCFDFWERYPEESLEQLSDEEQASLYDYYTDHLDDDYPYKAWYDRLPHSIAKVLANETLKEKVLFTSTYVEESNLDCVFVMDMTENYRGMVIYQSGKIKTQKVLGDYYDISDHPALDTILQSGSAETVFERSSTIPNKGRYYIGYKPVFADGKLRGVIGLAYDWDKIHSSALSSINKALILNIGGILLVMVVVLAVLYRRSVRPAVKMQKAILDYTVNKNSSEIVSKMYSIKENNELQFLADSISDMVLEIDSYTKQNIRIAAAHERAEKELYEAKVQIMVSQIRPHFMYNALSSIAMLCTLDPEKAQEAIVEFSDYIRGNMDSLKQTAPVPFEKEIEHLKKYLYIEKLRYGKKLNIVYDIRAMDFEIPLLSIQPIVENAVKHGVGQKKKGGTITISSEETEEAFTVTIADDGVGFDTNAPRKEDGRSHIGIENTRKRLKDLCNADVVITSVIGEGTTARVIIPKDKGSDADTWTA